MPGRTTARIAHDSPNPSEYLIEVAEIRSLVANCTMHLANNPRRHVLPGPVGLATIASSQDWVRYHRPKSVAKEGDHVINLHSRVIGLGSYLPPRVVTNDDLAQFMDTSDEWIVQRTGIKERRWDTFVHILY